MPTFCSLLIFFLAPSVHWKIVCNSQNIRAFYMLNHTIRCIYLKWLKTNYQPLGNSSVLHCTSLLRIIVSVIIVHTNKMAAFFYAAWLAMKINHCFLVNKHGDLYLLLHNFGALTILFRPSKKKKMFLVWISIKKRADGRFFVLFIISYCMLSLYIITFPRGYVGALRSNINKTKHHILIKHKFV